MFGAGPAAVLFCFENLAALESLDAAHTTNLIIRGLGIYFVREPNAAGLKMLQDSLEWQKRRHIKDDQTHCVAAFRAVMVSQTHHKVPAVAALFFAHFV